MKFLKEGVALALLAATVTATAQKAPHYPIEQFQLPNGMKVILSQDHSTPVVGLALAYDVGSRNELQGHTGFAHLFEHMMFQGSAHVGKGEHPRIIGAAGGVMNGFTRAEDTTYIETVPAEKLPTILWLEADRMRSLAVTSDNLKNQQEVVKEEKRLSFDNRAYSNAISVRLPELAYSNYANQHSTIGSMADLDAASLSDVQSFFKTYYAPNNATLVLVGDFDPKQARDLVTRAFSDIPKQPTPPKPDLTEPTQTAEKRATMTDPLARLPGLMMAWHGPSLNNPETYAVDILCDILFGGDSSRGYQEIVKKRKLALQVQGRLQSQRGPSLIGLISIYPPNVKEADLEQAIYAQIEAIQQSVPSVDELNRIKTRLRAQRYSGGVGGFGGLDTMLGRAILIADYAVFQGDPNLVNTELERYMAVTPEQVQAVAKKYFTPQNRSVLEVQAGAGAPTSAPGGKR
ncbi:MAG: Peptidase [Chthonomonadaceae bacterium]|nr:Peptidase [Chthonomonadaceae bacterium]